MEKITSLQKHSIKFFNPAKLRDDIAKLESSVNEMESTKAEAIRAFHAENEKLKKGFSSGTMHPRLVIELENTVKYHQHYRDICDLLLDQLRGQLNENLMFLKQSEGFGNVLRRELSTRAMILKGVQRDLDGLNGEISVTDRLLGQARVKEYTAEIGQIKELLKKFVPEKELELPEPVLSSNYESD